MERSVFSTASRQSLFLGKILFPEEELAFLRGLSLRGETLS